jgi:hypothetical protein
LSQAIDDKKPVQDGRKNKLKDVEASLSDQIPAKLAAKLEEMKIGTLVKTLWYKGQSDRHEVLERQRMYLQDWDEFLESSAEGPFNGSSSLHIPMPLWVCKTFHARFYQAIMGSDPCFQAKATNPGNVDRVPLVQDTMRYALGSWMNEGDGAEAVLDQWVWDWVTTGIGIVKQRWEVKYQRFVGVEKYAKPGVPRVVQNEDGSERLEPTYEVAEREKTITKKCFEGPWSENKHLEDVVCIGHLDPQKADHVLERCYLTASEMWTLVDRKIFREEQVKQVITSGPNSQSGGVGAEIKQQRASNAGQGAVDTEADLDRYEVIEAYLRLDVDGSGINSDIVAWVHLNTGAILRASYLYRINSRGKRPFFQTIFHMRDNGRQPIGLLEMLHPLSVEMDAMHNMRIDFGMLATMPFGFYRPTSSIEAETLSLEPGALIPLDNPQTDVYFPNLGNRTAFGMQEEAALLNMVERVTSISDLSLGIIGGQGATRTATGTRALVGEASANLDIYLRRFNRGFKSYLGYLFDMLKKRIPPGLSFRVTGENGQDYWRQVRDAEYDLYGEYDFELSPNSANSNQQLQQETAQMVLQLTSNPLDYQLGIFTPLERYEAIKNVLQSRGVKDYGRFIKKPAASRIYTPEEEANRILLGVQVPVTPEQDHEGFLNYVEYIMGSDELLGQFNEEQTVMLAQQAQKHQQMLQAMNQMAAQQANQMQMRMNASMGAPDAMQLPVQAQGGAMSNGGQGAA